MSGFHREGYNVELKIALKRIPRGPTNTSFPVFSISFVILSKDEALLFSKVDIPSKICDLVNFKSRFDLNFSQFCRINCSMSSSLGLTMPGVWLSGGQLVAVFGYAEAVAAGEAVPADRAVLAGGAAVHGAAAAAVVGGDSRETK